MTEQFDLPALHREPALRDEEVCLVTPDVFTVLPYFYSKDFFSEFWKIENLACNKIIRKW